MNNLRILKAETEKGDVTMFIETPFFNGKSLQVKATGNLKLDMLLDNSIGYEIMAKTGSGNIKVNARGANILEETQQYCLARLNNYFLADRKLFVTAYIETGNIEINVSAL